MFTCPRWEDHCTVFGVGPICKVLPIASSTYYARVAVESDPDRASDRAKKDVGDRKDVERIYDASSQRYGARKIWHALRREGKDIARCTVERLMKAMEIQGVVRGGKVITTNPDTAQPCPDDKVNREFVAQTPNQLWVSDFTYVSSWQGMVCRARQASFSLPFSTNSGTLSLFRRSSDGYGLAVYFEQCRTFGPSQACGMKHGSAQGTGD